VVRRAGSGESPVYPVAGGAASRKLALSASDPGSVRFRFRRRRHCGRGLCRVRVCADGPTARVPARRQARGRRRAGGQRDRRRARDRRGPDPVAAAAALALAGAKKRRPGTRPGLRVFRPDWPARPEGALDFSFAAAGSMALALARRSGLARHTPNIGSAWFPVKTEAVSRARRHTYPSI
jgi:hypothetical protein